jgi:integrase
MASVVPRKTAAGEITSYQVKWREGGGRTGEWQHERFDDEDSAKVFKKAVDEAGQHWPVGWIKGKGLIDPATADELRYRFDRFARESIENRTASKRYKQQRQRAVEMYLNPTFGNCDVRSTDHFSKATVGAWVNKMMVTKVKRGSKTKVMAPETLRGLHGLLSSILEEAVIAEPPLRDRNPCDLTRLPSGDDWGVEDDESSDDMEFMTPEEIAGLVACFSRASDRMLVRTAYASGMRWGEISALAARHARNPRPGKYELRVTRAWKRAPGEPWFLGPPKSKAGRRTIEITAGMFQELVDFGLTKLDKDDLLFHDGSGNRLPYSTFYDRWVTAVAKAKKVGALPNWKFPTFHDVRHSHSAALLSDGHSLTYVQRRLGHESIKTTSDRYGHLLETAHEAALVTLDRVMGIPSPASASAAEEGGGPESGRAVYVAHLGPHQVAFWDQDDAEGTAERWVRERGGSVQVEHTTAEQWEATVGGKAVRTQAPGRAWVWNVGPVVYAVDGTERASSPTVHEPQGRWVFDFEEAYTDERSVARAQWRPGSEAETEAAAWGLDQDAVRDAYAQARTDALRICSLHPASEAAKGRDTVA